MVNPVSMVNLVLVHLVNTTNMFNLVLANVINSVFICYVLAVGGDAGLVRGSVPS